MYKPEFYFILTDVSGKGFPKDSGLFGPKELTMRINETVTFDDRDDQDSKVGYYNALFKGIAVFEPFVLYAHEIA